MNVRFVYVEWNIVRLTLSLWLNERRRVVGPLCSIRGTYIFNTYKHLLPHSQPYGPCLLSSKNVCFINWSSGQAVVYYLVQMLRHHQKIPSFYGANLRFWNPDSTSKQGTSWNPAQKEFFMHILPNKTRWNLNVVSAWYLVKKLQIGAQTLTSMVIPHLENKDFVIWRQSCFSELLNPMVWVSPIWECRRLIQYNDNISVVTTLLLCYVSSHICKEQTTHP